jgi:hypothetical protein
LKGERCTALTDGVVIELVRRVEDVDISAKTAADIRREMSSRWAIAEARKCRRPPGCRPGGRRLGS